MRPRSPGRALLGLLVLCAATFFSGCATPRTPDELLTMRLCGRWCADGYAARAPQPVYRDELLFNRDNTFSSARVWPNRPTEQRYTYVGYWIVSDGDLVQYWPRPGGRGYRKTVSTILKARPRELIIQTASGPVSSYNRQPRLDSQ